MARLTSYNRTVILKARKSIATPEDEQISERVKHVALSRTPAGALRLQRKTSVRFRPDKYDPKGRLHSWGWCAAYRVKPGLTPDDVRRILTESGYTIEEV